jgi:hypothetical protein
MIDLSSVAGLVLDPWQEYAAQGSCLLRPDGKWAAFRVGIAANRQNGKGSIMEARQLAGLFLWGEQLQVHTSHEFRTAQKHFERILSLIEQTPTLDRLIHRVRRADGEEAIETKSGTKLQFMARSLKSGRGITGDTVYLDEAFALKHQMIASLMSTMSARSVKENPQLWYASSAGMPESEVLWSLREAAIEQSDPRLAYLEWSAPDDADPDDPAVWAQANPAMGVRISEDFVRAERKALGDEEFKRERLGVWARLGGESFIPARLWAEAKGEVEFSPKIAFAVDVPPERDRAVIAAASMDEDGRVSVEVVDAAEGTEWVATALATLQGMHNPVTTVIDAGGAAGVLIKDLRRERVKLTQLQYRAYGQACGAFLDLVNQGKLTHSGQTELDRAADAARQSMMGDTLWKWSRKDVEADISPLVAVTLAVHGVLSRNKSSDKRKVVMV